MAEGKAQSEKSDVDLEFIYTVIDEAFPGVRSEIRQGVTKDKGPKSSGKKDESHVLKKYRHKPGSECPLCKKHRDATKSNPPQAHESVQMLLHDEDISDGPPPNAAIVTAAVNKFNRELLKTACQIMGCKPIHGHLIAEDMFEELNTFVGAHRTDKHGKKLEIICMKKSTFLNILTLILKKYEYSKPQCVGDFENATKLVDHRCNLIILLGGSSGTGKSTLASLIASRLGISTVLSTDTIRHIMRNFVNREENPILFCSTYEAAQYVLPSF